MNTIRMRTDISLAAVKQRAAAADNVAERKAWAAIAAAMQKRGTAARIARRQRRSRPWFYKVRSKFQKLGLEARYTPGASGRPPRLTDHMKQFLRRGFLSRSPIRTLRGWLKERGVDVSSSYLYSLRKKWGCVPARPPRAGRTASGMRRADRLKAHVPTRIIALIRALLRSGAVPNGPTHKKLGMLFYLELRHQVLDDLERGLISASEAKRLAPLPHKLMAVIGSSRRFIYEVRDNWSNASGDWQMFVQRQLSSNAAKDVLSLSRSLQLDIAGANTTGPLHIYLDDHVRVVLGRGLLRREKWNETKSKWVDALT
jgi:transposase